MIIIFLRRENMMMIKREVKCPKNKISSIILNDDDEDYNIFFKCFAKKVKMCEKK